ncbi:MAG: hypothetical protein KA538_06230 [Azonexus sp.]|jgi:hypothetical protein|nr:hypothetical protein [Azonexus sp.]
MQPEPHWQEQTRARFIALSRLHFGLVQPAEIKPPRRVAGSTRQMLRSLLVAGSLGALFGSPAFASEASRQTEPGKRHPNSHSSRLKADDLQAHANRLSIYGKHR